MTPVCIDFLGDQLCRVAQDYPGFALKFLDLGKFLCPKQTRTGGHSTSKCPLLICSSVLDLPVLVQ